MGMAYVMGCECVDFVRDLRGLWPYLSGCGGLAMVVGDVSARSW
jgi:hypothetical protein